MEFKLGEEYALKMDAEDPLAQYRERFHQLPGKIYMDGNSLGLLSIDAEVSMKRVFEEWKNSAVELARKWKAGMEVLSGFKEMKMERKVVGGVLVEVE